MKKISILITIIVLLSLFSCKNSESNLDNKDSKSVSNDKISASVTKKESPSVLISKPVNNEDYSDFNRTHGGLLYKFHRTNDGATLTPKDVVEIKMNYFLNDSLLFTSQDYPRKFNMPVENSVFEGDLYEGLAMMHVGDSASFVIRADSTYMKLWKKAAVGIKNTDVIRFDISVVSREDRDAFTQRVYAKKREQAEQSRADLQVYLNDNEIVEKPRPSGLIIQTIIEGYGAKASSGDVVKIHYTAELIDGTFYRSTRRENVPETLYLANFPSYHPRGLSEALHQMREGEIAKVIIPSHLAFGQKDVYNLPPFANFVYDVEVVEVIKNNN